MRNQVRMKGVLSVAIRAGLISFVLLFSNLTGAQNGIFLSGAIDFGVIGKDYAFAQNGAVLQRQWKGTSRDDSELSFNPEVGLSYYFHTHFGISFNVKLTNLSAVFHDQPFMEANEIDGVSFEPNMGKLHADSGNFNPSRNYLTPNVAFRYIFNTSKRAAGPYVAYGVGLNYLLSPTHVSLNYFHPPSDELLELSLHYKKWYPSHYLEVGYVFFPGYVANAAKTATRGSMFDLSFRYTFAGAYFSGNYRVSENGTPKYTDTVSMRANYFSVVVRIGGSVFARKMDEHYKKKAANDLL